MGAAEQLIEMPEVSRPNLNLVIDIARDLEDELSIRRAQKFIETLGSSALSSIEVDNIETIPGGSASLMEAVHNAAWGDEQADKMLEANAASDVIERTIKSGNILTIKIDVDENDRPMQHGQTMESVYANNLRFGSDNPKLIPRSHAETRNGHRLESVHRRGLLKDNYFVVITRPPEDMSDEELEEEGFFAKSKTWIIQATTKNEDGSLEMKSAFLSGVENFGDEQRHDEEIIIALGDELGVDLRGKTTAELIDTPLLISKQRIPNGVVDLAKMSDDIKGTFFGENRERQDYQEFELFCRERQAGFDATVQKVKAELIENADQIHTPREAIEMLDKLSEKHTVTQAIQDNNIDARVFGPVAANHIEQARMHYQNGDHDKASNSERKAQQTAQSSSCPFKRSQEIESEIENATKPDTELNNKDGRQESLSGKIRCIKCRKFVEKKQVVKKDCWECPACNHKVDICSGKTLRTGKIKKSKPTETEEEKDKAPIFGFAAAALAA